MCGMFYVTIFKNGLMYCVVIHNLKKCWNAGIKLNATPNNQNFLLFMMSQVWRRGYSPGAMFLIYYNKYL